MPDRSQPRVRPSASRYSANPFFEAPGPDRAALLTHVSAGGAGWIHPVVRERALQTQLCLDAFHVAKWANEKLDEPRAAARGDEAATLGAGMWALRQEYRKLTPANEEPSPRSPP